MARSGNQFHGRAARELHDGRDMTDTIVTLAVAVAALLFATAYSRRYLSREKRAKRALEKRARPASSPFRYTRRSIPTGVSVRAHAPKPALRKT